MLGIGLGRRCRWDRLSSRSPIPVLVASILMAVPALTDPEAPPAAGDQRRQGEASEPSTRAELERQFKETFTNATLKGTWQMTGKGGLAGDDPLTEPRPDTYEISSAAKLTGDHWLITARIRFADTDVTLPVPVRVLWAGDTPVITVDSWNLPGVGAYSARVMIFGRLYCGVWFSTEKDYGGTMSGRILHQPPPTPGGDPEGSTSDSDSNPDPNPHPTPNPNPKR